MLHALARITLPRQPVQCFDTFLAICRVFAFIGVPAQLVFLGISRFVRLYFLSRGICLCFQVI